MSSQRESRGTNKLYDMLIELSKYKRDRKEVLESAVNERLNESFKNYYESIVRAYDRLEYENELRLLRKLNKM